MLWQGRDHLLRRAVGERAEDEVGLVPIAVLDLDEVRKAGRRKMGKYAAERLAGVAVGGERALSPLRDGAPSKRNNSAPV